MKLLTSEPIKSEDYAIVTLDEIKTFQDIGRRLAKVVDARRGTIDNKISVEADGFMRIYGNDNIGAEDELAMGSTAQWIVNRINSVEPYKYTEDYNDDDDDEDDYEDYYTEVRYTPPTRFVEGAKVEAIKDLDYGAFYDTSGVAGRQSSLVIVPEGTLGVVIGFSEDKVRVRFSKYNAENARASGISPSNDRTYRKVDLRLVGCLCSGCKEAALERAEMYPR